MSNILNMFSMCETVSMTLGKSILIFVFMTFVLRSEPKKAHLTFMFPKSYKLNITNPFTFIRTIQLNLNYEQVFYSHRTICLKCIKHIAEKRRPGYKKLFK